MRPTGWSEVRAQRRIAADRASARAVATVLLSGGTDRERPEGLGRADSLAAVARAGSGRLLRRRGRRLRSRDGHGHQRADERDHEQR